MSENKTALITGASSGIGYELSKILIQNGYDIIIVSKDYDNLRAAHDKLSRLNSDAKVIPLMKDLSIASSPQEIYDYTKQNDIRINVLINNAGIQVYGHFHEAKLEDSITQISVNLIAMVKLTRLFLIDMTANNYGKILNIGSTGSFSPGPLIAIYSASKAFVLSFSEAISEELRNTGITVTALCPGATNTNFAKRADIENTNLFRGKTMTPEKVAAIGYKAMMNGRITVVAGIQNKLLVQAIRFLPRRFLLRIGKKMMEKRK